VAIGNISVKGRRQAWMYQKERVAGGLKNERKE
jgi:hypothetical protein